MIKTNSKSEDSRIMINDRGRSQHPHPNATHNHNSLDGRNNQSATLSTDQKEAAVLLRKAPTLLKQVESSYLLQHHRRSYPTFRASEVTVGPLLGLGGFGVVFQVENLTLHSEQDDNMNQKKALAETAEQAVGQTTSANIVKPLQSSAAGNDDKPASIQRKTSEVSFQIPEGQPKDVVVNNEVATTTGGAMDDSHYDVEDARRHMVEFVRRDGEARYAIKRLHKDLSDLDRARGQVDLALEATFLSGLWHPNIIKMRAMAEGDLLQRHFFIIMDRLYDTLDVRIKQWKERHSKCKGNIFGRGADKKQIYQLNVERLTVAYDLAAALAYMHANQLVYRDLKQQNIGFDIRGDVKIFDFGLSKSIDDSLKAKDSSGMPIYGYHLTPRTGSLPYMAPEIVERKPYDQKADVFSFAILFWEILALRQAFKGFNRSDYLMRVVRQQERPSIYRRWPLCAPIILKDAWKDDPEKRPPMKRVATLIRGDLNELCHDDTVTQRSMHMRNRSAHSAHLRMLLENGNENEDDE